MLSRIKAELVAFGTLSNEANSLFIKTRNAINDKYMQAHRTDRINKAKDELETTLAEGRAQVMKVTDEVLNAIKEKTASVASVPVEADFNATLEALKVMETPSKMEIDALISKYKTNYISYRASSSVVGGKFKGYSPVTMEQVINACDELRERISRAVYSGKVNTYNYRMLAESTFLDNYSEFFSSFLNGYFDKAGKIIAGDTQQEQ